MGKIDVTIAMPVYNASDFIEKSLRTAFEQTHKNIEILILNDCSTDGSIEVIHRIAEKYHILLTIYNSPKNKGVGAMRNKAIELAKGDYLYFLDSDDYMSEDCLELMISEARKYDADLVIGSHMDVRDDVKYIKKEEPFSFDKPDEFATYAFTKRYGYAGGVWNKLMKTDLLRQDHILFPDFRVGEDVPFIFQLITKVQKVVLIDKVTYQYIIRPGSLCQYNPRDIIPKREVDTHVASKLLLKDILSQNIDKPYYIPMLTIVMDYCLDTVRVIIEKRKIIEKQVSLSTLKQMMHYPAKISQIMKYGGRRNYINYLLCHMPLSFVFSFFIFRKFCKDMT